MMINIDDLVGLPYKKNGRGNGGYDCYGLAVEVERRFGHEWLDIEECSKSGYDFNSCLSQWKSRCDVTEVSKPERAGDVILIKDMRGVVSHIGVYLGNGMVIHCNFMGVHVDRLARLSGLIGKVYSWV